MGAPPKIEQWRAIALDEIDSKNIPFPPEYVMSIIRRESGGEAGAVNRSSGASGLMQVMRISLNDYNNNHQQKYSMDQLRGTDKNSGRIQIRVGLWILTQFFKSAYRYLKRRLGSVPLDDLVKITDTYYASGPGNVRPKLDRLERPNWESVKARYPDWHRIIPAEKIWDRALQYGAQWDMNRIDQWLEGGITDDNDRAANGALIGILIILAAWYYFQKRF